MYRLINKKLFVTLTHNYFLENVPLNDDIIDEVSVIQMRNSEYRPAGFNIGIKSSYKGRNECCGKWKKVLSYLMRAILKYMDFPF